jgi:hypothetical protein
MGHALCLRKRQKINVRNMKPLNRWTIFDEEVVIARTLSVPIWYKSDWWGQVGGWVKYDVLLFFWIGLLAWSPARYVRMMFTRCTSNDDIIMRIVKWFWDRVHLNNIHYISLSKSICRKINPDDLRETEVRLSTCCSHFQPGTLPSGRVSLLYYNFQTVWRYVKMSVTSLVEI